MTNHGFIGEVEEFNKWLGTLPYEHKIVIAGNHDFCFEHTPALARQTLTNATYLQDESVEILGLKFYGSPWQPWFYDWAFNLKRGKALADVWAQIPLNTDVLITHGPPYGILDATRRGEQVGCQDLTSRVQSLNVKFHCFGHIHEGYGMVTEGRTQFVNASSCNLEYQPINEPVVVEIEGWGAPTSRRHRQPARKI